MTHAPCHSSPNACLVRLIHNLLVLYVGFGYETMALFDLYGNSPAPPLSDLLITRVTAWWLLLSPGASSQRRGRGFSFLFRFFLGLTVRPRMSIIMLKTLQLALVVLSESSSNRVTLWRGSRSHMEGLWADGFSHITPAKHRGTPFLRHLNPHAISDQLRAVPRTWGRSHGVNSLHSNFTSVDGISHCHLPVSSFRFTLCQ